ncbi:AmmeMemoRadiSam system radical SAM enzyme [Anaerobaca lacustris]|uniref:AmmeMemoRadiSam system radical SAM enzyme n=1 Tax=Anaerobaca lacustris TaxID=3044600 RepID=A0AAW6TZ73_9BACT|nr:AmmeMemoRadiSam system radical SAM enzyme [Sedimentisphaerales bacterium M17dextr]
MANEGKLKEAVLWEPAEGKRVRCVLCGFRCRIDDGKLGHCCVRQNVGGTLYSLNYDKVCAANPDPIEKKPLFHFQPGTRSFSVAAIGCNFRCEFCQNWQISQVAVDGGQIDGQAVKPEQIVAAALRSDCRSIAYTYTEPTVFMELCADCGRLAKEKGLANVFVSNGYMTREAIDFAADWLDGINVDLKAFTDDYYRRLCKARLQPVLDTIATIARQTDIWIEVTTLLVPGENDSEDELKHLADFLVRQAGPDVPWHISRFQPQYRYADGRPTPMESLQRAERIGREAGLRYVYLGNVPGARSESTFCHGCGRMLIERVGFRIVANEIQDSRCPQCGTEIAGFEL